MYSFLWWDSHPCADPEGGTGGPDPPPEKSQKYRVYGNTGPNPLKNCSYQASIQCWAIIGTPAKRHLFVKVGPPLTKLSGSAHATLSKEGSWTPVFKTLSERSVLSAM